MRPVRRLGLAALGCFALAMLAVVAGWLVDAGRHDDRVVRNAVLAGHDVSGLNRGQLERVVRRVAASYRSGEVRVRAPKGEFTTPAEAMGLTLDERATVQAALRAGKNGSAPGRFVGWITAFIRARRVPARVAIDQSAVYRTVLARDPGPKKPAREPSIKVEKGKFVAVAGESGNGMDPAEVIEKLPAAAAHGTRITVGVGRGKVRPRHTLEEAKLLARQAQETVTASITVRAGTQSATISLGNLRSWVRADPSGDELEIGLDEKATLAGLAKALPRAGTPPVETKFAVAGGGIQIVPGKAGTKCCAETAVDILEGALRSRSRRPPPLPLRTAQPQLTVEEAQSLGVKEAVGSFTTRHPGGQPRVRNIHKIADLVRGQVIEPGKTFSVNDFVGRRTESKGFVNAPVIEEGRFSESIGGGVSQFATTLFNAAFLAGLDFAEYQSHSIYISRYPYGREATLSYPHPDLKLKNPTPYGVLIWPTYSETAISVTLYSTKFFDVSQTGQEKEPRGVCTRVDTERTRKQLASGRTEVDHVFALYRPAEGLNCAGQPTPTVKPPSSTTTTTAPPPSSTAPPPSQPPSTPPPSQPGQGQPGG